MICRDIHHGAKFIAAGQILCMVFWTLGQVVAQPVGPAKVYFHVSGGMPGNATGFNPDDDDTFEIQRTIDEAIGFLQTSTGQQAVVVFEVDGSYDLRSSIQDPGPDPYSLLVRTGQNTERLIFEGNNATLLQHRMANENIGIRSSRMVTIMDLNFDYAVLPYVDGRVQSVSATDVVVQVKRGTRPADFPPNDLEWGMLLDRTAAGRPKAGTASFYLASKVTDLGMDLLEFRINPVNGVPLSQDFEPGDRFTYHFREGGNNIQIRGSSDVELLNCTSFASSAMFVNADSGSGLSVVNCCIEVPPNRWRSTNGDGVHVANYSEVSITGCCFAGVCDDAIALNSVDDFLVSDNLIIDKRRHAILLDANSGVPKSSNGAIRLNTASENGSSFLAHFGGDYSTVTISDNKPTLNNIARSAGQNRYVRLVSSDGLSNVGADIGSNGQWNAGDNVLALPSADVTDRSWHLQEIQGEYLIVHRAARDTNAWLYLSNGEINPDNIVLGAVDLSSLGGGYNPSRHYWNIERENPDQVRFEHRVTGNYLTRVSSGNIRLAPFNPTDQGQLWSILSIED